MTAELVRGQNHPLSRTRVEIRVSAGVPVLAGAALGDEHGTVRGAEWVAHPGAPHLPGIEVSGQAAADHRIAVDLAALPEAVQRVSVLLALPTQPGCPLRFGAVAAPQTAVTAPDGTEIARFTLTGLDAESAVVALELYRRNDTWKVRAVGQGYALGLPALLADQGLAGAGELAAVIQEAVAASLARAVPAPRSQDAPGGPIDYSHPHRRAGAAPSPSPEAPAPAGQPTPPVAGDAVGWSMEERLYNQVWGMFEDLARTTAAYRGAVEFADSRLEKELDQALADPRNRLGGTGEAAREAAQARHTQLSDQARAAFDRDLAQLTAESEVVEPALPPAFARWDNPVWHGYRVPAEPPMALRLGDLCLPESALLRIPLLARLPLERGLWIDSGPLEGPDGTVHDSPSARRLAMESAVALAARLLAVHPAGEFAVQVVDAAGAGAEALLPLVRTGAVAAAPASGAAGVAEVLERLTRRVDLTQMAVRGGAAEALPPDVDAAQQLLIVNDFPHGFDDRAVTRLRYLADEGPAVGVHLLMVADREDAEAYGPLLDPLWRSLMRLTPVPCDHLADPWVGHAWTYEPCLVPPGSRVLEQVLTELTEARTKRK
ncbi:TerD family protein [Streptomyces collinus]|uniref:Export associated protein n=1 Tax=Streptomyces collinus (strain DSM 40733 / Tue 365) TaxID=1214242 RepID=S5VKA9_STRC3|nr:TerD family protein [Streptomyces collinus]AGS68870.1 export associated protein [Streptomyces collinus Tu 365]UJA07509.1 export associated protein [Streptomyces collinus]UJA17625.1 export associated protein [Streptomyces collinus]